jgi:hypothetical protein
MPMKMPMKRVAFVLDEATMWPAHASLETRSSSLPRLLPSNS